MLAILHDDNVCVLRPVPFISITQNAIRNKNGMLGSYYDIVLNGTILPDEGSPYYLKGNVPSVGIEKNVTFAKDYQRPGFESINVGHAMASIVTKQNLIRELFKRDGQLFELLPASVDTSINDPTNLSNEPILKFYPTVQSISFEEGPYVAVSKYTVNLRAELLFDHTDKIISDGLINSTINPSGNSRVPNRNEHRVSFDSHINEYGGFIEDYTENWSIEAEEGKGTTNTSSAEPSINSIRTYRLTRNMTATGRTVYKGADYRYEAWENARNYIYKSVLKDTDTNPLNNSTGYEQFPEYTLGPYFASGYLNISKDIWGGYNHLRTESIDVTAGTFTINDTWLLSSGTAYEDYRMSLSKGSDNGLYKVSIDGTIKGLSSAHAGHSQYGGTFQTNQPALNPIFATPTNSQHQNALYKWHQVSNTGQYGPNCHLFKRSQSLTHQGLNHIPLSIALGSNEFTGEITYNVEYDSRPTNIVSGALSESITYSDTYPGDVFAVIPVIGRQTGPVLQYIGGRTEYQRNLNIELVMDKYYSSGVAGTQGIRQFGVLSKPSLNEPFKSQINSIIHAYSPVQEQGIRKYFVSPPQESWDAKSGRYSLTVNWTYELNR
jgi:hypothetical protein